MKKKRKKEKESFFTNPPLEKFIRHALKNKTEVHI